MQSRVRSLFVELFSQLPEANVRRINAGQTIDAVSADIQQVYDEVMNDELLSKPLGKFKFLST